MLKRKEEAKVPPHLEVRFYGGERQHDRKFHPAKFPHVSPDSTFIASIGTCWSPGAWQKVVDMVTYTSQQGISCWLHEFTHGVGGIPCAELDALRNVACVFASSAGFEWLLIIENDILPEPDMLVRLLSYQLPVVVPYIRDKTRQKSISDPPLESNIGLQPIGWSALSCVLIWTKVLNCFPDPSP